MGKAAARAAIASGGPIGGVANSCSIGPSAVMGVDYGREQPSRRDHLLSFDVEPETPVRVVSPMPSRAAMAPAFAPAPAVVPAPAPTLKPAPAPVPVLPALSAAVVPLAAPTIPALAMGAKPVEAARPGGAAKGAMGPASARGPNMPKVAMAPHSHHHPFRVPSMPGVVAWQAEDDGENGQFEDAPEEEDEVLKVDVPPTEAAEEVWPQLCAGTVALDAAPPLAEPEAHVLRVLRAQVDQLATELSRKQSAGSVGDSPLQRPAPKPSSPRRSDGRIGGAGSRRAGGRGRPIGGGSGGEDALQFPALGRGRPLTAPPGLPGLTSQRRQSAPGSLTQLWTPGPAIPEEEGEEDPTLADADAWAPDTPLMMMLPDTSWASMDIGAGHDLTPGYWSRPSYAPTPNDYWSRTPSPRSSPFLGARPDPNWMGSALNTSGFSGGGAYGPIPTYVSVPLACAESCPHCGKMLARSPAMMTSSTSQQHAAPD